jgi:hypothetical protein
MENGTQNAMMLSVVVDGRKLTPFVNLKGKNLLKNVMLELYVNLMRKDG